MAPINETDMIVFPKGLKALQEVAKEVGLALRGAALNLDGGFDAAHHRKGMFHVGLIPNITENPRNRTRPKRGRKRLFNAAIYPLHLDVCFINSSPVELPYACTVEGDRRHVQNVGAGG